METEQESGVGLLVWFDAFVDTISYTKQSECVFPVHDLPC